MERLSAPANHLCSQTLSSKVILLSLAIVFGDGLGDHCCKLKVSDLVRTISDLFKASLCFRPSAAIRPFGLVIQITDSLATVHQPLVSCPSHVVVSLECNPQGLGLVNRSRHKLGGDLVEYTGRVHLQLPSKHLLRDEC